MSGPDQIVIHLTVQIQVGTIPKKKKEGVWWNDPLMKSTFLNIHLFTFHIKCHNYCHKYYTCRIVIGCLSLLHKSIIFSLSPTVCHMDSCGINCDILCGLKIFVFVHILSHYLLGCQLLIGLYYLHMGSLIKVLPITN